LSTFANSAGVSARIIRNSHHAKAAVPIARRENRTFAQALRSRHQTRTLIAASVRHAEALIDQMIVMRLIL